MTSTQIWLAIIGMTFVTAVTRAMFLIGGERTVLPERVQRMLRYAPAAALAAVVLPDVLATPEGLSFAPSNHEFYATLSGLVWFLWRRTMLGTIVVGMVVFTLLRLFV
ncbi:AzlD domain-containing protein [Paraburkholderia fungorum]|jgi:branched-subunit amino acid transport protein|uniref:AzlD domain-containing protein n=1 Tax=Paraburkholderia fungorum TaxID=134537 RepID=A0AAJ3SPW9_9BURK|nr:AzlD domain-containing protein [Paraburkholderia fungorum]KFX63380.1 branched-chain amino acid transporter [Burkholderia sp. K24]AJZ59457.1 branched-chain amino acid transport family protein [Paraburkholderia fungorum]MBB4511481.1 branched-subunit amino acid transport protein [Paraburkholderia fungorum]MBB5542361.1 branched-subunit amino acid transport protein [Paraburkholderia fungorum]MBB6199386.1 branched-subunit amino acid transport protein [Paraburkholderia fungorum]